MNYWFQSSDYSSVDLDTQSFEYFVEKIKTFDHTEEKRKLDKLISNKEDNCPFGFGITGDKGLLHITYDFDDEGILYQVYESYENKKKLLGIFTYSTNDDQNSTFETLEELLNYLKKLDRNNL